MTIQLNYMRFARRMLNQTIRMFLNDRTPQARRCDVLLIRKITEAGRFLGYSNAARFNEKWASDAIDILCESVLRTPYGAALELTSPLLATLEITNACNKGCRVCYSNAVARPSAPQRISGQIVAQLARSRIPAFLLTGGEPLEHPRIVEILSCLLKTERMVSIATASLTPLVNELARQFPNKLTFVFSFWGDAEKHDHIRGNGSYAATTEFLQQLSREPALCTINYVAPDSAEDLVAGLRQILSKSLKLHRIYVSRGIAVGRYPYATGQNVSRDFHSRLRSACESLGHKTQRPIVVTAPRKGDARPILDPWSTLVSRMFGIVWPRGCGVGNWTVHITADGDVRPCFAHEGTFGNVMNDCMDESWRMVRTYAKSIPSYLECSAEASQLERTRDQMFVTLH